MMRNLIGQAQSSLDIRSIMDEGKILLVNLSKGDIGENNSALLGSVLVNLVLIGALRRRGPQYASGRRRFHLIVDEYQNFANRSFAILQSEARKFAVDLIVAHQYRDQLDEESMGASLNVGNFIVFRVSGRDSYALASQFDNTPPPAEIKMEPVWVPQDTSPEHDLYVSYETSRGERVHEPREQPRRTYHDVEAEMANSLSTLNNYQAYCRLIRRPTPDQTFLGEYQVTTEPQPRAGAAWREEIRQECIAHSRATYGRERQAVEDAIYQRTGGRIETTIPASGLVEAE
jgi:hypothetical protein